MDANIFFSVFFSSLSSWRATSLRQRPASSTSESPWLDDGALRRRFVLARVSGGGGSC